MDISDLYSEWQPARQLQRLGGCHLLGGHPYGFNRHVMHYAFPISSAEAAISLEAFTAVTLAS